MAREPDPPAYAFWLRRVAATRGAQAVRDAPFHARQTRPDRRHAFVTIVRYDVLCLIFELAAVMRATADVVTVAYAAKQEICAGVQVG